MQKEVPGIVITGGPCAAKTTAMSYLIQKLGDYGFTVVVVSEVATDLISCGLAPWKMPGPAFQRLALKHMIQKEDYWREGARMLDAEKVVMLHDRGAMDAKAYMLPHEFEILLGESGYDIVSLRDRRYDAVIALDSLAKDRPDLYTCANNAARTESVEEARALNERTLAAWTGHPHLRVIGNEDTLDSKLRRILQAVCRVLAIPAPLEIERKYLYTGTELPVLPQPMQQVRIEQYYLAGEDPSVEERVRARSQNGGVMYFHTFKRPVRDGVREEHERQVSHGEYLQLLHRADPTCAKIEKDRYCFVHENQYFEFDVIRHGLQQVMLLEIEQTDESATITLPEVFLGKVEDVTDAATYSNHAIALRLAGGEPLRVS